VSEFDAVHLSFKFTKEQVEYLDRCCRIRNITRNRLVSRLMSVITTDQMVQAILDDEVNPRRTFPTERRNRFVRNRGA
jgi:hypothetical protein